MVGSFPALSFPIVLPYLRFRNPSSHPLNASVVCLISRIADLAALHHYKDGMVVSNAALFQFKIQTFFIHFPPIHLPLCNSLSALLVVLSSAASCAFCFKKNGIMLNY